MGSCEAENPRDWAVEYHYALRISSIVSALSVALILPCLQIRLLGPAWIQSHQKCSLDFLKYNLGIDEQSKGGD